MHTDELFVLKANTNRQYFEEHPKEHSTYKRQIIRHSNGVTGQQR